jgi:diguanylate cyclase (GGDEF)-like protein
METGPRTRSLYQLHEPSPLSERARLWWLVGGGLYAATLLWAVPRVADPLSPLPAIPLAHALSLAVVTSVTAVVLWVEARRNQVRGYALLAAVFSSIALLLVAFTLAFPGALTPPDPDGRPQPLLGGGSTSVGIFMLWHIVITVGIPAAAVLLAVDERRARPPGLPHGLLPWVLAAVVPTLAVCAWWLAVPDAVPPLISGMALTALGTAVVLLTCTLAVVGLAVAIAVTRGRSSLSRWLIALCVLNLGDAILNLGAERYSVGWYVGRALGFVALSALLVVLVVELGRIDRRTDVAATTDALTGLRNRMGLLEELEREMARAQRDQRRLAVLALDLDGFKSVNDAYGHPVGDALLVETAKRLQRLVRGGDLLVRMGGDEFVVVLVGLESARVALTAADRIVSELGRPVEVDGRTVDVTVSLGLTIHPGGAETADDLLRHADRAMYEAKASGGDTVRMFAPQR